MDLDKETEKQIQELQFLEQNFQQILMQKQAFQLELSEIENALNEMKSAGEEVYKITGQIMLKAKKQELVKELSEKKELVSLRIKTLDKEEQNLTKTVEDSRKKIMDKIQK